MDYASNLSLFTVADRNPQPNDLSLAVASTKTRSDCKLKLSFRYKFNSCCCCCGCGWSVAAVLLLKRKKISSAYRKVKDGGAPGLLIRGSRFNSLRACQTKKRQNFLGCYGSFALECIVLVFFLLCTTEK
jgi:hypothetical protein